jgi:hypothetical protein
MISRERGGNSAIGIGSMIGMAVLLVRRDVAHASKHDSDRDRHAPSVR